MLKIVISSKTFHFINPAGTSRGVYTTRQSFFVTLTSDDSPGVQGMGECATLPDLSCDAMPPTDYERTLRTFCDVLERTGEIDYEAMRPYRFNALRVGNGIGTVKGRRETGYP